jgi:hypothetical protein
MPSQPLKMEKKLSSLKKEDKEIKLELTSDDDWFDDQDDEEPAGTQAED